MIFVDTSAWYALLDEDDVNHRDAVDRWHSILDGESTMTHGYVVVESTALIQRRLGLSAAIQFHKALLPPVETITIDQSLHARSVERWLMHAGRRLSLVDVASFVVMEQSSVRTAFAYDGDFTRAGFEVVG